MFYSGCSVHSQKNANAPKAAVDARKVYMDHEDMVNPCIAEFVLV